MSLIDLLYRWEGKSSLALMREIQSSILERVNRREDRLDDHLNWCRQHVPYYANHLPKNGKPFERLKKVPIFPKTKMNVPMEQFTPRQWEKGTCWDHTSGTSGRTFRFLISPKEKVFRRAYELFSNDLLGFRPGNKHLVIWGGHESAGVKKRIHNGFFNLLSGRELITIPGTDKKNLHTLKSALERHNHGLLITYPSILLGLCEMGCAKQLQAFNTIILTGEAGCFELFEPYELNNLKNRYGTREFGAIACGVEQHLFYFADRFILEHDEDSGLLITDLERRSMPLLRYPVGDFAPELGCVTEVWNDLPSMGVLQGRVMDRVLGLSGRAYIGTFWTLTMRSLGVEHFRIRQVKPGHLHVTYVSTDKDIDLEPKFQEKLAYDFNYSLQQVDHIPSLQNAKQRIVEVCSV